MKKRTQKRLLAILLSVLVIAELVVSVVLGTVAENTEPGTEPTTATVTKQLVDFTNCEVGTKITDDKWPAGIAKMDYEKFSYSSNFDVDIAEDANQEKFLKFSFNKANSANNTNNLSGRGGTQHIYLKVSVPYWYINYIKDFKLDYVYNYNKSGSGNRLKAYYILGLSDGETFSKDVELRDGNSVAKQFETIEKSASVQEGSVSKVVTNLSKFTGAGANTFLGATQNPASAPLWTAEDLGAQTKLDVVLFFSAPYLQNTNTDKNAGYYFGIKGVSVTLEGPTLEIENIDNEDYVTPDIIDFENGTTIDEVKTNYSKIKFTATKNSILSEDAFNGNNAFLFKRWKDTYYVKNESGEKIQDIDGEGNPKFDDKGNPVYKKATSETYNPDLEYINSGDYDTRFGFYLERNVTRSKGVTFMVKNITNKEIKQRVWIKVGNDTGANAGKGKYQVVFTLPANMTEYKRISIYWDNVGLMSFSNGGEWWANSTSGNAITADELASGITLDFKNYNGLSMDDPGILYDDFEYITKKFTDDRTVTVVDFSNCVAENDIPSNITISGNYEGSTKVVEDITTSKKSLVLNYDKPAAADTKSEMHHLRSRNYFIVSVSVPRGALDDVSEIAVDMTNNRTDITAPNGQRDPNTALYNIGIADSTTGKYGKNTEINDTVNFIGNKVVTKKPVGMREVSSYHMTAWTGATEKWTADEMKNVDTIVLYVSAPDCDGTEGESFQLNSIILSYNEPPKYNEEKAREIVHSEEVDALTSGNITAKTVAIGNVDPNNAEFDSAIEVAIKDVNNTERLYFKNQLSEYHRNLEPFFKKETAIFHMFAFAQKDTKYQVALIDKNGAELTAEVEIPAATTKLYTETSLSIKKIYDAASEADRTAFDMTDIRAIAILPVVEEPTTIRIAGVTVLTGDYVSSANDPEKQKIVNLVNFDNCTVGSKNDSIVLPSNVTVSGYAGSKEIVKTADGSNALQVNFDKVETVDSNEAHQTRNRTNITINVSVPKGSLEKLNKVTYTLTNNGYALSEQINVELRSFLTMAVRGNGTFVKQGESAARFNGQKGVATTVSLQVKDGFTAADGYNLTSWCNKNNCYEQTEEHFSNFDTVTLYIAVPTLGSEEITKGWNFQINSIDLEFEEKPAYNEPLTRMVVDGNSREIVTTNKDTITAPVTKLASNNINYRTFKRYFTVEAKSGNTAPVVVENSLSKFLRNIEPFKDTATFRMYYKVEAKAKAQVSIVNINGERLPFEVALEPSDSDKFTELAVSFKDIYEKYLKNADAKFDLKDLTNIEILPLTPNVKINIASPTIWSKEAGNAGSVGNYYYATEDDAARIEAYNYNITDDFKVTVEFLNAEQEIAANGTRLPQDATVVKMIKVSLRNAKGELAEPAGRFWVSFRLPNDIDLSLVKMYEVFYDGSLKEIKHVVMDANNYLSCEDFFSSKIFAILIVPPVKEVVEEQTEEGPSYYYEVIVEGEDVVETPSQETIRKIIRRRKKAKNTDYTWLWTIIIIVAVVVLLVTGLVILLIVRKKRKS